MLIGGPNIPLLPLARPGAGAPTGPVSGSGDATQSGSTSATAAPAWSSITAPSQPPASREVVQPSPGSAQTGSATSRPGGQPGPLRARRAAGTIEAEIRRIEDLESAEITGAELIKQASVALLAQANIRREEVLDILRG